MPRGLPDYYNPDTLVSQRLANVEEVVTAIQGIANLDNRGKTLTFDNFNNGVGGFYLVKAGDGIAPVGSILKSEIGPASMRMDAGTDTGSGKGWAYRRFRIQSIASVGLEIGLAYEDTIPLMECGIYYDNGVDQLQTGIRIDMENQKIELLDATGWIDLIALEAAHPIEDWLTVKFVVDLANEAYSRLLVGQTQTDISDYAPSTGVSAYNGQLVTYISATPFDDTPNIAYIGHVAITIDEP